MEANGARVFIRTKDDTEFREVELPAALEVGTEVLIGIPFAMCPVCAQQGVIGERLTSHLSRIGGGDVIQKKDKH